MLLWQYCYGNVVTMAVLLWQHCNAMAMLLCHSDTTIHVLHVQWQCMVSPAAADLVPGGDGGLGRVGSEVGGLCNALESEGHRHTAVRCLEPDSVGRGEGRGRRGREGREGEGGGRRGREGGRGKEGGGGREGEGGGGREEGRGRKGEREREMEEAEAHVNHTITKVLHVHVRTSTNLELSI